MKLLEGKVAIVTGAARGIGEAVAIKFAEHGANIAFTYVSDGSKEKAAALEAKLQGMGVKAKAYQSNAGDFAACETFVTDVLKEFGTVDICVNNAGISKDNLLLRMSVEQWEDVIKVNLNSVFYMTKQIIKPMMKARSGSIINMSSVIGEMGNAGQTSYAASKAGIIGFTKSVAHELGSRNITVNCVAPGFIATDMTAALPEAQHQALMVQIPLGKLGTPEDIAHAVSYLASPLAGYVTGQELHVNGGMHMS